MTIVGRPPPVVDVQRRRFDRDKEQPSPKDEFGR
jgi:hypothetical protein